MLHNVADHADDLEVRILARGRIALEVHPLTHGVFSGKETLRPGLADHHYAQRRVHVVEAGAIARRECAAFEQRDARGLEITRIGLAVERIDEFARWQFPAFNLEYIVAAMTVHRRAGDQPSRLHARKRLYPFDHLTIEAGHLRACLVTRFRKSYGHCESVIGAHSGMHVL